MLRSNGQCHKCNYIPLSGMSHLRTSRSASECSGGDNMPGNETKSVIQLSPQKFDSLQGKKISYNLVLHKRFSYNRFVLVCAHKNILQLSCTLQLHQAASLLSCLVLQLAAETECGGHCLCVRQRENLGTVAESTPKLLDQQLDVTVSLVVRLLIFSYVHCEIVKSSIGNVHPGSKAQDCSTRQQQYMSFQ